MRATSTDPEAMDWAAVHALRRERIDWRFKGMPHGAFDSSVEEFLDRRPTLSASGFVGPLLVVDNHALEHNLRTMADWCDRQGLRLAPHGKTTMAPQLFARQFSHGAWGMTAATVSQARVYRAFGVRRIVFANQLVDPHGLAWLSAELDRDPGFTVTVWVDSVDGVNLMSQILAECGATRPVDVLVELGGSGGRTGVRSATEALRVADAVEASPWLRLAGVAGYEGEIARGLSDESVSAVDGFMRSLREVVGQLDAAGLFAGVDEVVVTAGGSSFFDQVAEWLAAPWPTSRSVAPVLRSGAYLTHDDGLYRTMSPFGRAHRLAGAEQPFRPAMRVWSQVTSRPEPGLALLTMGRRDVSFDQHFPEPQVVRDRAGTVRALPAASITALADQHAFLSLPSNAGVEIGDWIGCGLSHPCTVFDKWPLIPLVEGDEVVDLVRTFF